jgi:hypothetical protein
MLEPMLGEEYIPKELNPGPEGDNPAWGVAAPAQLGRNTAQRPSQPG